MALELTEEQKASGWQVKKLGEILPLKYGKSLPQIKRVPGSAKVYGSSGISGYHNEALIDGKHLIIGRKGSIGTVHWAQGPCFPIDTTFYTAGIPQINIRWAYYLLQTFSFIEMNTDSAVPGLNRDVFESQLTLVPPKQEQDRIAEILGSVDDKIEANSRLLDTLSELAIAEVERLDLFSATPNALLGEIVKFSPKVPKPDTESYKFVDMSVLPTSGAVAGAIGQKETWVGSKFQEGDTLFSRITPCLENGKTAIAMGLGKEPGVGSTEFIVMRPINKGQELFVYGVARNQRFREIAIQKMTGTSGRQRVKWQDLAAIPVNSSRISEFRLGKTEFELMRSLREENISLTLTRDLLIRHLIG